MARIRFEPTIALFELSKTLRALDRASAVIGNYFICYQAFIIYRNIFDLLQKIVHLSTGFEFRKIC
jgi:hypothetical protein